MSLSRKYLVFLMGNLKNKHYFKVISIRLLFFINPFRQKQSSEVFCKKGVFRSFIKFTGKHLWQSLFFNKVAHLRPATLLKKRLAQVFSCEFYEISKNTFFYRTLPVAVSEDSIRFPFLPKKQTGLT